MDFPFRGQVTSRKSLHYGVLSNLVTVRKIPLYLVGVSDINVRTERNAGSAPRTSFNRNSDFNTGFNIESNFTNVIFDFNPRMYKAGLTDRFMMIVNCS
jgi:hypothetical protein